MLAFLSSHDDEMIIILLLQAACDLAINKQDAIISLSLTVDEVKEEEAAKSGAVYFSINFQKVHSWLCSISSMIMHPSSSYTSYSSLVLIPLLLVRKKGIHCQEFSRKIRSTQALVFHQLSGTWAGME